MCPEIIFAVETLGACDLSGRHDWIQEWDCWPGGRPGSVYPEHPRPCERRRDDAGISRHNSRAGSEAI